MGRGGSLEASRWMTGRGYNINLVDYISRVYLFEGRITNMSAPSERPDFPARCKRGRFGIGSKHPYGGNPIDRGRMTS